MQRSLFIFILIICSTLAQAQSKKAIKEMAKAREYTKEKEYSKALGALNKAIEEDISYVDAYLFKADILNRVGDPEMALAQYVSARNYEFPYYLDYFQGRQLYGMKRYEESIPFLQSYLEHPRANAKYKKEIELMIKSATFAMEALKHEIAYNPINLGPKINSNDLEYFPSISADGRTLVFTHRKLSGQKLDEDFWFTQRDSTNASWSKAQMLPGSLNTNGNEGAQSISADGRTIFFAACERPDGRGSCDIYASFLDKGRWSKALNLGPAINSSLWESQPSVSPDGRTIYFVRGKDGTDPNMDIFYSNFNPKKGWSKAKRVPGKINTASQETSPYIHFDNQHLYFSSSGHPGMGDLDFFVSEKELDGSWGEPRNLGHPINTSFQEFSLIVAPDGQTGFFSSDALEGGIGKLDLYEFNLPLAARAKPIAYVAGKVIDQKTRKSLSASLKFTDLEDTSLAVYGNSNSKGRFYAVLPAKADYGLSVTKKGYLFYSKNFALSERNRMEALELLVELIPIESGQKVILENIFFDYDSYDLSVKSDQEIQEIFRFLTLNPDMKVRLEGHTDDQGGKDYNAKLSLNRARTVHDRLIAMGILANRISFIGLGSTKPIVPNDSEANRARNRRTELHIR